MYTGLTDRLLENDQYLRLDNAFNRRLHETYDPPYTETFDGFIDSILATDLLDKDQKQLLRGLRNQWIANKKRG